MNFNVGADLRQAIKNTTVGIIGEKGSAMFVTGVQDAATRAQDASATAGRAFTLTGGKLKIAGTDPIRYPFFCAKLFSARSVSAIITTATDKLIVTTHPLELT